MTDEQESQMKTEMLEDTFFDKYFETNLKFRTIEEELIKTLRVVGDWYINANYEEQTCMEINGCNEPAYIILMQYYLLKKFKDISIEEVFKKKKLILFLFQFVYNFFLESIWVKYNKSTTK